MSTSGDFEFETILAVALRHETKNLSETQKTLIQNRLDRRIQRRCRISSLTIGLDAAGVQTVRQHDSLNHSVFYVGLGDDGSTRFSMENAATSTRGTASPGELIMKFQSFKGGSWKEVMSIERPWLSEHILTLRHLMIFVNIATVNQFTMLNGCRSWVKGLTQILIEGNLSPMELREELARQPLPHLGHYFKYYYTSHGVKTAQSDGEFLNTLKNDRKIMEDY